MGASGDADIDCLRALLDELQGRELLKRVSVLRVGSLVVELEASPPSPPAPDAPMLSAEDIEAEIERRVMARVEGESERRTAVALADAFGASVS